MVTCYAQVDRNAETSFLAATFVGDARALPRAINVLEVATAVLPCETSETIRTHARLAPCNEHSHARRGRRRARVVSEKPCASFLLGKIEARYLKLEAQAIDHAIFLSDISMRITGKVPRTVQSSAKIVLRYRYPTALRTWCTGFSTSCPLNRYFRV